MENSKETNSILYGNAESWDVNEVLAKLNIILYQSTESERFLLFFKKRVRVYHVKDSSTMEDLGSKDTSTVPFMIIRLLTKKIENAKDYQKGYMDCIGDIEKNLESPMETASRRQMRTSLDAIKKALFDKKE